MLSGIYKITNIINNKIYIGSAVNLKEREYEHFRRLNKNNHCNIILQNSYNKYKVENFKFEVIEKCDKKDLINKEQYYIDLLKPYYNICKIAGSKLGVKHKEESKLKLKNTLKRNKELNGSRKLNLEEIEKIKLMLFENYKLKDIALQFNVSVSTISKLKIKNNIIPNKEFKNRDLKKNNVKYSDEYVEEIKNKFNSLNCSKYQFIKDNNLKNYFYKIL